MKSEAELKKLADKDTTIERISQEECEDLGLRQEADGPDCLPLLHSKERMAWRRKGEGLGYGSARFPATLGTRGIGRYENFFNDILEVLFYDTLATDRGHEAWCNRFKCRIPFLNGGLFEPLAITIGAKRTSSYQTDSSRTTSVLEHFITGTGILDVFDRYNFTVNEAEPLEKEVAIDPEMLGKSSKT